MIWAGRGKCALQISCQQLFILSAVCCVPFQGGHSLTPCKHGSGACGVWASSGMKAAGVQDHAPGMLAPCAAHEACRASATAPEAAGVFDWSTDLFSPHFLVEREAMVCPGLTICSQAMQVVSDSCIDGSAQPCQVAEEGKALALALAEEEDEGTRQEQGTESCLAQGLIAIFWVQASMAGGAA